MKTLFFMIKWSIFNLGGLFYRFAPKTSTKKEKFGMKGITINMVATIIILFMVFIILVVIFTRIYNAIPSPL